MSEIEELRATLRKRFTEVLALAIDARAPVMLDLLVIAAEEQAEAEIMRLRQELADARAAHATQVDMADEARAGWERDHAEIVRLRAALVKVETTAMGLIEVAKTESEETAFTRYAISRGRMIRDAAAAALNLLAALAPARQENKS